ncbi:putative px domain-containing protein [Diaporthe ampelina]|uniref:Putative px domain-containing protein n=1 Tax=Diaporthe ampelina TaxID=1214573 RepID=A0A0G2H8A5_9PEZI|nr:putative px domain-containing protein [Diaporthe ampelina]
MAADDKTEPISPTAVVDGAPASIDPQTKPSSPISSIPKSSKPEDDVTTRIFQFLSTATPGTLAGIAVGLAAVTYFVLGQLGLLLIGAFGGVALYIHWEASNPDFARSVRGEKSVDIVARLLGEKNGLRDVDADRKATEEDEAIFLAQSFADFQPETQDALNDLVDAVIRDYVKWWYDPIVPSDRSFPLSCRRVLTSFLVSVGNYLGKKRPADSFLDFLTNTSSIVIVFFSELSQAFADLPPDSTMTAPDAVYNYLASNPDSNLSHLLSQRHQASKFKSVAEDLLGFLDRPTHDCDPARTFLREVLASVILEMSLQTCSKAEWINGWIVYLLEAGEPDFSQAIDVGMQTGPEANNAVFADLDGNVGNIGLTKGNRNSLDLEKARRRESAQAHKKKLSKADEEMEVLEEMKRMNQMLLEEDARRSKDFRAFQEGKEPEASTKEEVSKRLADALQRNADELDIQSKPAAAPQTLPDTTNTPAASVSGPPASEKAASTSSEERPSKELPKELPPTPKSIDSRTTKSIPQHGQQQSFTSFDQIVPPSQEDSDQSDAEPKQQAPLTLHNAKITIYDDGTVDKSRIRTKPTWDYLIQIEPSSSQYSGWMIVRQYFDFEKLHEVLRRIAAISGITAFTEQHKELPQFKVHTRESLRGELERYLRDACWYKALAESEGMKRFLDKDQGHTRTESKSGFQAVESFGKNVPTRQHSKISEQETRVAVELVFAIINELYSLSSAWNFRRTLLAAAKSFLLRPGNPSLVSIQKMIQDSVIEANSSDEGIAAHLRKLRENTLPTEEELKAWPPESSQEEKDKLREKARRLLIQSGVPAALSGVMGQNATNEALGRIFDCLQIEEVARGLMFGIMLQGMRVITH